MRAIKASPNQFRYKNSNHQQNQRHVSKKVRTTNKSQKTNVSRKRGVLVDMPTTHQPSRIEDSHTFFSSWIFTIGLTPKQGRSACFWIERLGWEFNKKKRGGSSQHWKVVMLMRGLTRTRGQGKGYSCHLFRIYAILVVCHPKECIHLPRFGLETWNW